MIITSKIYDKEFEEKSEQINKAIQSRIKNISKRKTFMVSTPFTSNINDMFGGHMLLGKDLVFDEKEKI